MDSRIKMTAKKPIHIARAEAASSMKTYPIPGTDMTLHYASNRVKGFKSNITIPASGDTVPSSLKNIIVKMELAGRIFETTLPAQPNQRLNLYGMDWIILENKFPVQRLRM